jgi:hypothetical protein
VARVAYDILKEKSPATVTAVTNVLSVLKSSDPSWTTSEGHYAMVECATFADEIKGKGGRWQQGWHFVDTPYVDQKGKSILNYPGFKWEKDNSTSVMHELISWFKKEEKVNETDTYQTIMSHTYKLHTEEVGLSTAMRLLIHYVGDIHQPLHSTSRVDDEFPEGDRGGNSLKVDDDLKELHAVWDSVLGEFSGYPTLPFSSTAWRKNGNDARRIREENPVDDSISTNLDPFVWGAESYKLSVSNVYPGIVENGTVPEDYRTKNKKVAERQISIAGARLANLLISLGLGAETKFL